MRIKSIKDGKEKSLIINAPEVRIVDVAEQFKSNDVEGALKELALGQGNIGGTALEDIEKLKQDKKEILNKVNECAKNIDNSRTTTAKDVTGSINELNRNKQNKLDGWITDFNTTLTQGEYAFTDNTINQPNNWRTYGKLKVIVSDGGTHNNADNWIWQLVYFNDFGVWIRNKVNEKSWSEWNKISTNEEIDLTNTLRNGWQHGGCSFRAKKMGDELFVEGIIFNNLQSPNNILAQLSAPKDGRWHGGSAIGNNNTSLYLVLDPSGILTFQSNGHFKDILYTINIHYPI